jgi:hypothetical protein
MSRKWKPGDALPPGGIRFWFNGRALKITLDILKREYPEAYSALLADIREQVASPVVMISPEDGEAVERLWQAWRDLAPDHRLAQDNTQAALREFANPKREVFRHFVAKKDGGLQTAHCGKVWRANAEANVVNKGDCPECTEIVRAGWSL